MCQQQPILKRILHLVRWSERTERWPRGGDRGNRERMQGGMQFRGTDEGSLLGWQAQRGLRVVPPTAAASAVGQEYGEPVSLH